MSINRPLLILGILLAVIGAGAIFVLNTLLAPPPALILAAREDIPAGTLLDELPEAVLVTLPVQLGREARPLLRSLMQPEDLAAMRAAGGVLIQDVFQFEPILLSSVVSAGNPAAVRVGRLGIDDPGLIVVVVSAPDAIPDSLTVGDRVDLAVAVDLIRDPVAPEGQEPAPAAPGGRLPLGAVSASPQELLQDLAEAAGAEVVFPGQTPTPTLTPTPTATGAPALREPLAKVLVHGARVVRVLRDRSVTAFSPGGETALALGDILALEVVIPRDAFEMVAMASRAGALRVGLLSPLVEASTSKPTLGASLQDLIDLFYADREALAPTPTATLTASPTPTPSGPPPGPTGTAAASPTPEG